MLARVPGDVRAFQFATHSGYQRLEAGPLRMLFDVGGAPPAAFSERAHASALAFELSSENERLIVNIGAARELEPAGRMAARATNGHSTLVIADALSAELDEQRRGKGPARLTGPKLDDVRRSSDESGITVQGRHDGYRAQFGLFAPALPVHRSRRAQPARHRRTDPSDAHERHRAEEADPVRGALPSPSRRARADWWSTRWRCSKRRAVSAGVCAPTPPEITIEPLDLLGRTHGAAGYAPDRTLRRSRSDGAWAGAPEPHSLGAGAVELAKGRYAMKALYSAFSALLIAVLLACGSNESNGATMASVPSGAETIAFQSGTLELHGLLYKPEGAGPFPAVLYNHGSAPGLVNNQAFDAIAPVFVERGWAFFAPYRRGQGLSEDAGPYILDEIAAARGRNGSAGADETMTRLLATDHLNDQLAALDWLRAQPYIRSDAIAVMGNSFGGIQTLLGAARADYCAAVDAAGGAEAWDEAPALRELLTQAARSARTPVFFMQAENDFNLAPSRVLFAERQANGLAGELHIYPAFGTSHRDGHSFPFRGVEVWRQDVVAFMDRHCLQ